MKIKRALISVSNKLGAVELAKKLSKCGVEIISTGGTGKAIRAAAKNFKFVTVVTNPDRYDEIAKLIKDNGEVPYDVRKELAAEAFAHTADYDAAITKYLSNI